MNRSQDTPLKRERLDKNVGRLLAAAYRSPKPDAAFKVWLRAQLDREMIGLPARDVERGFRSGLDDNLSRVLVAATSDVSPRPEAKQTLRHAIQVEVESRKRSSRAKRWVPRLVAAGAPAIILVGFFLYPLLWSHVYPHTDLTVTNTQAEVLQTRPLFFNLGTRVVKELLVEGESIPFHPGDTVLTGPDSSAVMSVHDSGRMTLYPESEMVLLQLAEARDGERPSTHVRLDAGLVKTDVTDVLLAVDTPAASASVEGTEFKVAVVADSHTYVATDEGTVRVDMGEQRVRVSAGEAVDAIVGQPLAVLEQGPPLLVIDSPVSPEVENASVILAGKTDVDAMVTVNGSPVPVGISGAFEKQLTLEAGSNSVQVTATSPVGKSVTVALVLVLEQD